jgi:hypothetical protein
MKRALFLLTALPVMAAAHGAVAADCVTVDPVIVSEIRLDPMSASPGGELVQTFNITFRGAQGTPFLFRISDEDSGVVHRVGQTAGPVIDWTHGSVDIGVGRLEAFTDALGRGGGASGIPRGSNSVDVPITLRLSDLQADLAAGIYREQFTVRFNCNVKGGSNYGESMGAVAVSVAVPNVISVNVAGASASGQIDFQDFATLSRSLNLSVRSTGPFRVRAASENAGAMVRDRVTNPTDVDLIPYSLTLDGQSMDVGSWSSRQPRVGLTGRQFPLEVTAADISSNRAGEYRDELTITFEPLN